MELLLIIVVIVIIVGLVITGGRRPRGKGVASPEFDVVEWHGRTPAPGASEQEQPVGDGFANATTWVKRDAICHLTGRTAADCTCDRHRKIT
ncbi:hypothetical protein [Herbidospora mongoliensis]|uniref:hypothetical protein n=1 Tax=Herbidospora mongoliensis TaxID=688067 RepID=UPI00082C2264|nr:hypothetical protein [Herbidospora mongoliensis]